MPYSLEIYILIHRIYEYVNFLEQSGLRDVFTDSDSGKFILVIHIDSSCASSYYDMKEKSYL